VFVFARDATGGIAFHAARRLTTLDVAEVLAAVEPRLRRLLGGAGSPSVPTGPPPKTAMSIDGRTRHRCSPAWQRRPWRDWVGTWDTDYTFCTYPAYTAIAVMTLRFGVGANAVHLSNFNNLLDDIR